jgi:hypothetical protein
MCDPDETCTGTAGDSCPADVVSPAQSECRASTADCDPAEICSGIPGDTCPSDALASSGDFCDDCPAGSGRCEGCDDAGICLNACGNGTWEPALSEQCDGSDDSDCPGQCQSDCTCKYLTSCLEYHNADPKLGDGSLVIDPDGPKNGVDPFTVYCDMTTGGGGWTLCFAYDTAKYDAPNWPDLASSQDKLLARTWGETQLFGDGSRQGNFCNLMTVDPAKTHITAEVVRVSDSAMILPAEYALAKADFFTQVHDPLDFDCLVSVAGKERLMYANYVAPVNVDNQPLVLACFGAAGDHKTLTANALGGRRGIDTALIFANGTAAEPNPAMDLSLVVNLYEDTAAPSLLFTTGPDITLNKLGLNTTWFTDGFDRVGPTAGPVQCIGYCGFSNSVNDVYKQRIWIR